MIQVIGIKIVPNNKVHIEINDEPYSFPRSISAFQAQASITPEEYALVQKGNLQNYQADSAIYQADLAISMKQMLGGFNHDNTNREALKNGFKVPTPSIFLPHYYHANEALARTGVLYDASGNIIEKKRLKEYLHVLNYKCWVRLNGMFPKEQESGTGFLGLDLAVITGFDSEDKPLFSRDPLENCLEDNCWADLESLNSQGFPTKKSKIKEYIPGKVIRFWYPREDSSAEFYAGSLRAILGCSRDSQYLISSFGAFLCSEEA